MIEVTLNGEKKTFESTLPLGEMLDTLGVRGHTLMVEQNGNLVKRDQFDSENIADGDVLELIRLTGGG